MNAIVVNLSLLIAEYAACFFSNPVIIRSSTLLVSTSGLVRAQLTVCSAVEVLSEIVSVSESLATC